VFGKAYHQESLKKRHLQRVAELVSLPEGIGWHTFRHTYRSWLDETGAPKKVQQELMRHASIQTTMNVYGQSSERGWFLVCHFEGSFSDRNTRGQLWQRM